MASMIVFFQESLVAVREVDFFFISWLCYGWSLIVNAASTQNGKRSSTLFFRFFPCFEEHELKMRFRVLRGFVFYSHFFLIEQVGTVMSDQRMGHRHDLAASGHVEILQTRK